MHIKYRHIVPSYEGTANSGITYHIQRISYESTEFLNTIYKYISGETEGKERKEDPILNDLSLQISLTPILDTFLPTALLFSTRNLRAA